MKRNTFKIFLKSSTTYFIYNAKLKAYQIKEKDCITTKSRHIILPTNSMMNKLERNLSNLNLKMITHTLLKQLNI